MLHSYGVKKIVFFQKIDKGVGWPYLSDGEVGFEFSGFIEVVEGLFQLVGEEIDLSPVEEDIGTVGAEGLSLLEGVEAPGEVLPTQKTHTM